MIFAQGMQWPIGEEKQLDQSCVRIPGDADLENTFCLDSSLSNLEVTSFRNSCTESNPEPENLSTISAIQSSEVCFDEYINTRHCYWPL